MYYYGSCIKLDMRKNNLKIYKRLYTDDGKTFNMASEMYKVHSVPLHTMNEEIIYKIEKLHIKNQNNII